ncbi:gp065 [Rhodococcus phage ReqiPepy6]|uniref:Gp065 n=1 Tax=Rhodococcus phage ReqiPepy6 TaxID=691965 RepID=D4P7H6_9CAUD|nr:gp065 [Rhodococcus phage ReqiPepy6]ADD80956.1 gp065 [Rhodococcus phage ReqiPepy6]
MPTIDQVKTHLRENKKVYIVGGACLAVGVLAGTTLLTKESPEIVVNPKIQQIMSWKPTATLKVHIEALGDPGNIIQDVTTGTVYASQGQAARALGVNPARISEHLSGKIPNVQGHSFKFLGKADSIAG